MEGGDDSAMEMEVEAVAVAVAFVDDEATRRGVYESVSAATVAQDEHPVRRGVGKLLSATIVVDDSMRRRFDNLIAATSVVGGAGMGNGEADGINQPEKPISSMMMIVEDEETVQRAVDEPVSIDVLETVRCGTTIVADGRLRRSNIDDAGMGKKRPSSGYAERQASKKKRQFI